MITCFSENNLAAKFPYLVQKKLKEGQDVRRANTAGLECNQRRLQEAICSFILIIHGTSSKFLKASVERVNHTSLLDLCGDSNLIYVLSDAWRIQRLSWLLFLEKIQSGLYLRCITFFIKH